MIPQSWTIAWFKIFKITGEVIKFIKNTMENWKIKTDSMKKKLNWGENSERDLPGEGAITITICNSEDATQSYT